MPLVSTGLCINELMASNDGAYIDEAGEVDDWVELLSCGSEAVELADFTVADGKGGKPHRLPARKLEAGERVLLWADEQAAQGPLHVPLKLGKEGDALWLRRASDGALTDLVRYAELGANESLARFPDGTGSFARCRLASPDAPNGPSCGALGTPERVAEPPYAAYAWPVPFPARTTPLTISELALRPAGFIELENTSAAPVLLDDWAIGIAPHKPGRAWPEVADGVVVGFAPGETIAAGARYVAHVDPGQVAQLQSDPLFEGVVTLFRQDVLITSTVDRVDFMRWPEGAVLARRADGGGLRFCTNATRGQADDCRPLPSREVGDRLRHLYTPGDYAALAHGATSIGSAPVKFVIEGEGGGPVHLLAAARWPLHFTFTRELVDGLAPLDRCSATGSAQFEAEFSLFVATEYLNTLSRRFLLGTLVHHVGADLRTVEFASGDVLSAEQMRRAFFAVTSRLDEPSGWSLRSTDPQQDARLRSLEGQLPIVVSSAPFSGLRLQPLTAAVGYGTLRFIPSEQLATAALGPRVIVVTDAVPNDMPIAGGLITEAFQTPLAHVNLLSQARDTPNMALAQARSAPELAPWLEQLVRFEVTNAGFSIQAAAPAEAQAFWDARRPAGEIFSPRRDLGTRGIVPLAGRDIADLPTIGAKAAQLAELERVVVEHAVEGAAPCTALPIATPSDAFAVPVVHYVEHFERSGAQAKLALLRGAPGFVDDPAVRAQGLAEVRDLLEQHPLDAALHEQVLAAVAQRFGAATLRFRSSSNAEDLVGFNGAGLYESESSTNYAPEAAIKKVWASLWSERAYDERAYGNISDASLAMAVLVHRAFRGERANGVAMSRNLLDPTRADQYYVNAQRGEAAVTNPAPNIASDQLLYTWPPVTPAISYRSRSSFARDAPVLSDAEVRELACSVGAIRDHFQRMLYPQGPPRWFTMEVEFKLMGDARTLAIKQARPFPFSTERLPAACPTP